jgi:hypothetical protein
VVGIVEQHFDVGLDRGHDGHVADLHCRLDDASVVVDLVPDGDADLSLEVFTAEERKGLLEEVLGRAVSVRTSALTG